MSQQVWRARYEVAEPTAEAASERARWMTRIGNGRAEARPLVHSRSSTVDRIVGATGLLPAELRADAATQAARAATGATGAAGRANRARPADGA